MPECAVGDVGPQHLVVGVGQLVVNHFDEDTGPASRVEKALPLLRGWITGPDAPKESERRRAIEVWWFEDTGVMKLHFGETFSKSTSPFSAKPDFLELSATLVIPTSITTAFSFTMSAVKNDTLPKAAMIMSACIQISLRLFVRLWQMVTVQLPGFVFWLSKMLIGLPTILLLPITTACLPTVSIL